MPYNIVHFILGLQNCKKIRMHMLNCLVSANTHTTLMHFKKLVAEEVVRADTQLNQ